MVAILVTAIILAVLWWVTQETSKRSETERRIAREAIRRLASYLRELTGTGPWLEMSDFYRLHYFDLKCTRCTIDTIFLCNANDSHTTECIDVHFAKGKLRVMYGSRTLFEGDPLHLMSYPEEAFPLRKDEPPPVESNFYSAWADYFNVPLQVVGKTSTLSGPAIPTTNTALGRDLVNDANSRPAPEASRQLAPPVGQPSEATGRDADTQDSSLGHETCIISGPTSEEISRVPQVDETLYLAFAAKERNEVGYIDRSGNFTISPRFTNAWEFSEELAAVELGGLWGCIDRTGDLAIPPQFGSAFSFYKGLANVEYNERWGYIDRNAQFVIPPQFDKALQFFDGLAAAKSNGKWGYVDEAGRFVIAPQFDWTWHFSDGLAAVKRNGKWGFIDITGDLVIDAKFEDGSFSAFSNGLALVKLNGRAGYIGKRGELIIPTWFEAAYDFSEGLAPVRQRGAWGFIDMSGKFVIPPRFEFASCFSEGLAVVKLGGASGYIDKAGEVVIPTQYRGRVSSFHAGLAIVGDGSVWELQGCIDKTGKFVIAPQFMQLGQFEKTG